MPKPWGLIQDTTHVEVFEAYTSGKSIQQISKLTGLAELIIVNLIKSVPFQADLKLLQDDENLKQLLSPRQRIALLQHRAIDALEEEVSNPKSKLRIQAATEILDRGLDVPKSAKMVDQSTDVPAEALAFLGLVIREVAGITQKALAERTVDITPVPASQP